MSVRQKNPEHTSLFRAAWGSSPEYGECSGASNGGQLAVCRSFGEHAQVPHILFIDCGSYVLMRDGPAPFGRRFLFWRVKMRVKRIVAGVTMCSGYTESRSLHERHRNLECFSTTSVN